MASALQELRRSTGDGTIAYLSEAVGIPAPSLSRFESHPEKTPTDRAWALADFFDVPIDVIVGRRPLGDSERTGEVQRRYDRLSPRSRAALDDFLDFLAERDVEDAERARREEENRYEAAAWRYERLFLEELEARGGFEDLLALGTEEELRAEFERFVAGRAGARLDGDAAEEAVAKVMDAYDRLHDVWVRGGGRSLRAADFFGEVRVSAEYDGSARGR